MACPPVRLAAVVAHALSLWTFLAEPACQRGILPVPLFTGLVIVSLIVAFLLGNGDVGRGATFLAAACPILPFAFLGHRPRTLLLAVGAFWLALPILARLLASVWPSIVVPLRISAIALLLPGSMTALAATWDFRLPTVADLFENGHSLLPASEYLRGELPYRDIVPGHGLAIDGLLQTADLSVFGDDYRGFRRGEKATGALFWPAFYLLGYAATGSPAFGFGGILFSFLFFPQYAFTRATMSVVTLALAIYAARSKKAWAWLACGLTLPVNFCFAVDFATYGVAGIATALWVGRGPRSTNLRWLGIGAAISGSALALIFGSLDILWSFLSTTFVFIPSLLPVYAQGLPAIFVPGADMDGTTGLKNGVMLLYGFFALSVVLLGAWLPRAPIVGQRARGALPLLAWAVFAMFSVLERHHTRYPLLVLPLGILLLARWYLGRRTAVRALAMSCGLVLVGWASTKPFLSLGARIGNPVRIPSGMRPLPEFVRARGALFHIDAADLITATAEMIRKAQLRGDDTWLDFANAPGLYYLFYRDCPIRYYEVPFYESTSAQIEVIEAVDRNPRVRAVLMSSGLPNEAIDAIPNAERAPLVAKFIGERFAPFYKAGAVSFWIRK